MANSYLNRTPGSTTDAQRKQFTISVWVKRSTLLTGSDHQEVLSAFATDQFGFRFQGDNKLDIFDYSVSGNNYPLRLITNRLFRDTSAWYNIVLQVDTPNATSSNRAKLWVNGVQETSFATATYPSQDYTTTWNKNGLHQIGSKAWGNSGNGSNFFDGYLSHVANVAGSVVAPTSFGQTDSTSGIWKFKTPSGITWGNNGFHLKFENSANLGLDSSGNSNNFTKNGNLIQSKDTPSVGLCTLNPNLPIPSGFNITNGNLSFACSGSQWQGNVSSIAPTKGKWYYECQYTTGSGIKLDITRQKPNMINMATNNQSYGAYNDVGYGYQLNNSGIDYYCNNNTCTTWNSSANGNSTKIYMVCIDLDNGKYWIGANGTWANKTGTANPATGTDPLHSFSATVNGEPFFITLSAEGTGSTHHANFGNGYYGTTAVSTNSGNGYSDANSEGKFSYQPPSGYYALTTKNYNTYG